MKYIKVTLGILLGLVVIGAGFVYLAPEKTLQVLVSAERNRSALVRKEIKTPDGLRWVYLEGGKGEPLVLVHGFGANKDNFTRTARALTPHYHVIIPDLIGFGESDHPMQAGYSPSAQAERLRNFIRMLKLGPVDFGGSSMGGEIAMSYASKHPAEVRSLWLLDPGGIWSAPDSEVKTFILKTGQNPLIIKNEDEFFPMLKWVMNKPPYLPKPLFRVIARERIGNYELEQRVFKAITDHSLEKQVSGLKTPALIVWGEMDRVINVGTANVLHKLLPNSKVIVMPGIGHLPMMEAPRESAVDYLEFREKLAPGKAA